MNRMEISNWVAMIVWLATVAVFVGILGIAVWKAFIDEPACFDQNEELLREMRERGDGAHR